MITTFNNNQIDFFKSKFYTENLVSEKISSHTRT